MPVDEANAEAVDAWSGVLFDRWLEFRDVVAVQSNQFSKAAFRVCEPSPGARVLDIGCGLGETTRQLGELVGGDGEVVGIDAGERFIQTARAEADDAGVGNVSYIVGDVQVSNLASGFDLAFSRFGTMFFANPVAALKNVRAALEPGGSLCMVVWRRKLDNPWLHRGELVADRFLDKPEETDEPTCGPGPFSMANADTVSDVLLAAGYEGIRLLRQDIDYRLGDDLDQALALVTSIGPAGELIRLAGDEAASLRPRLEADLRDAYAEFVTDDGVRAPASVWIVTASSPGQD